MNVIIAGSEPLAAFLRGTISPGMEVIALGEELDSLGVEEITAILSLAQFNSELLRKTIEINTTKIAGAKTLKIIVV
jgi:hypothetical protein